jgi:hypothetical protein
LQGKEIPAGRVKKVVFRWFSGGSEIFPQSLPVARDIRPRPCGFTSDFDPPAEKYAWKSSPPVPPAFHFPVLHQQSLQ